MITVRHPDLNFTNNFSYYRVRNIYRNAFFNCLHLHFPEGEKYFIRSIQPFLQNITEPNLKKDAQSFVKQEMQHSKAHESMYNILKQYNLPIDQSLAIIDKRVNRLNNVVNILPMSKKIHLAITAAAEHYTALLAENNLKNIEPFEEQLETPFEIRRLSIWHSLEELEHKCVTFDILKYHRIGYFIRIVGWFITTISLFFSFFTITRTMLKADTLYHQMSKQERKKHFIEYATLMKPLRKLFLKRTFQYFLPSFHPNKIEENINLETMISKYKLS